MAWAGEVGRGYTLRVLILLLCFVVLAAGAEDASNVNAVRRALEARYRHAATLKAVFYEQYRDGKGGILAESGTVYFSRPGRMRWEYESPEKKLFLVDGTNVWFYVPADRTASRAKLKESSDWRTPLALLTGKADLSHLCRKIEAVETRTEAGTNQAAEPTTRNTTLRCTPRVNAADGEDLLRAVDFETDADARLVRVLIHEAGNAETEFRFRNWEENLALAEQIFHFAPPPGVTIVDEGTLAGAIH
jgi:outer membrane lipoprotein carrier protein